MGNWTPSIVPAGEDQSVYLVVDDFGHQRGDHRQLTLRLV
jgi:hypothetical protein